MQIQQFVEQLERCVQSESEIRKFIADFALLRLKFIVGRLRALDAADEPEPLISEPGVDWTDPATLEESGLVADWTTGLDDPGSLFLHVSTALTGDWKLVGRYLELALLSDKQKSKLFPLLSKAKRAKVSTSSEAIRDEVKRLNALLRQVIHTASDWQRFSRYQRHLAIHGASQNIAAIVGAQGGAGGQFRIPAQGIRELHLARVAALRFEQQGAANDNYHCLRP